MRQNIWRIAIPVMIANVTIPLVGMVDTAVVGHLGEAYYIGAVSLGSFIFSLITISFGFQRMATTGLIAQAKGANDNERVISITQRAIILAIACGLIIIAAAPIVNIIAAKTLNASPQVLEGMKTYLWIIAWAGPAICINMVGLGVFFGLQKISACFAQMIIINGVNIVASLTLVIGFKMTIDGVAIASVIAQYCGLVATIAVMKSAIKPFGSITHIKRKTIFAWKAFMQYGALARDLTIRSIIIVMAEIIVLNAAAGINDETLAATQIGFVIFATIAFSLDGFAHAIEAIIGETIGQKNNRKFNLAIRESTILAGTVAACMTIALFFLAKPFFRILTSLPNVLEIADKTVFWLAILPITSIWAFQMDGVFIGATKANVMRGAMIVSAMVFLPILFIAKNSLGIHGIWIAFNIMLAMRGLTLWRKIPIVEKLTR